MQLELIKTFKKNDFHPNINELLFIETVTLTSLTKMKSVGVFDEKSYDQPTSGLEH